MDETVGTTLHTTVLVMVAALAAWLSGLPTLFPSLGPSAFVLAMFPRSEASNAQRVIGGHAIGVAAGLLAYWLSGANGSMIITAEPGSIAGLRLAGSGVIAIALTVGGMLTTDLRHPPACATTLIVALGLLSTPLEGALILAAVVVMVAAHRLLLWTERIGGVGPGTS
ncbi:HPP family protein [Saliphagus infecundisoli]|uniref:HPP family protein n=1 Tax=Saliphagus infecundisoli TaxID=1849069 RepID=A0ABD5Q973_9EURY|nr:HPP family protein [Saliphagus infecundisoli]